MPMPFNATEEAPPPSTLSIQLNGEIVLSYYMYIVRNKGISNRIA